MYEPIFSLRISLLLKTLYLVFTSVRFIWLYIASDSSLTSFTENEQEGLPLKLPTL